MLATASSAIIIGFSVRPELKASQLAEKEGVDIRLYNVIYEAIEDVKKALEGLLEPTLREKTLGRAEVRQVFPISRIGTVAGCYVVDGMMSRPQEVQGRRQGSPDGLRMRHHDRELQRHQSGRHPRELYNRKDSRKTVERNFFATSALFCKNQLSTFDF